MAVKPVSCDLENRLGYTFHRRELLAQALTHRSFGQPHNERLEFLGDSILNCVVAKLIFDRFADMPEGELSRLRANLVNQATLAEIASELGLGSLLRLGEGELKTGGANRASILADAFEALLGAIFIDADFGRVVNVVEPLLAGRLKNNAQSAPTKDAKTALQEWLQANRHMLPQYTVLRIEGEAHRQTFFVQCRIVVNDIQTQGTGPSRRIAEQDAASQAYTQLLQLKPPRKKRKTST
ncbi:MAG: ribonuclease III [Betaproteobacteria bacterium]|nr:ribonuclease III [Betaproteobacteria bacterium]